MTVTDFAISDTFRLTIIKHHTANPSDSWANTYEFQATEAGGATELMTCASAWVAYEREFHYDTTFFDRYVFSTWEPDSAPYDPLNFLTSAIAAGGLAEPDAGVVGLTTCLHVTRNVGYGRAGHLFYRNMLSETVVQAPSGITVLVNPSALNSIINTALADTDATDYMGFAPTGPLSMVMISADGSEIRPVLSFSAVGVSQVKTDHKWFNRTSPV